MRVASVVQDEGLVAGSAEMEAVRSSVPALIVEALAFIAPQKIVGLVKDWTQGMDRSGGPIEPGPRTMGLASSIVLFTPSLTGSTAFDRLAKARAPGSPAQVAALRILRQARLRLLRMESVAGNVATCTDLASGEAVRVLHERAGPGTVGTTFIAFMGAEQGLHLILSGPASLDGAARVIAMRHVQPGRTALVHPLRCAEAVYRHVLRYGGSRVPGIDLPEDDRVEEPQVSEIDLIAMAWSMSPPGATRDPRQVQTIRNDTDLDSNLTTLVTAIRTRKSGLVAIAAAYEEIAFIQLQTVQRRAAVGSGTLRLNTIEWQLENRIRARDMAPETLLLFRALRQRLGVGRTNASNAELEKVITRIQGLRAKTVERGCTEQEALTAAEKVGELLDRYGMTLGETELREQSCESTSIETGRKRSAPIDQCIPVTATFFGCRIWTERAADGTYRFIYFGLPADVAAARYLYDLVEAAFDSETAAFQSGPIYEPLQGPERRKAKESFQMGLALGIMAKLQEIRATRDMAKQSSGRRDLILVKDEVVDRELDALGLDLRAGRGRRGRSVMPGAFNEGQRAGSNFEYRPGVGHDG